MANKTCSRCGIKKELNLFIKNKICEDGRAGLCKTCQNLYSKNWKRKNNVRIAKRRRELYHGSEGILRRKNAEERRRIRVANAPYTARARILRLGVLDRSKKHGLVCDKDLFTVKYLVGWLKSQKTCECCNSLLDINFKYDGKPNNSSPSLDKFVPEKGYTKENTVLICWRCNNLKRDATAKELRQIVDWMYSKAPHQN